MRRSWLLVAGATLLLARCSWGPSFSMASSGLSRQQKRGTMHNKDRLPTLYELPPDEPEPEPAPKEPLAEHRPPFKLNIVAHFPDGVNPNWKYIEKKIVHALENTEYLIHNVDVRVVMEDAFHREKPGRSHHNNPTVQPEFDEDDASDAAGPLRVAREHVKGQALAPFFIKAKIGLHNHRTVVLSNAGKHAQASLTEAVDHAADGLRRLMREEKERDIRLWRKRHQREKEEERIDQDLLEDDGLELFDAAEALERQADEQVERLYRAVEASNEAEAASRAAQELGSAVDQAASQVAATEEAVPAKAPEQPADLKSMILGL